MNDRAFEAAMSRCEAARLEPPDLPEPLFDSLESCALERCGANFDCDDCHQSRCACGDWQDETDEASADDYAQKENE